MKKTSPHPTEERLLVAVLEPENTEPEESEHIRTCPECSAEVESLQTDLGCMRNVVRRSIPVPTGEAVSSAASQAWKRETEERRLGRELRYAAFGATAAALLLAVLFVPGVWDRGVPTSEEPVATLSLEPDPMFGLERMFTTKSETMLTPFQSFVLGDSQEGGFDEFLDFVTPNEHTQQDAQLIPGGYIC